MQVARVKSMLWLIAALAGAGAIMAVVLATTLPYESPDNITRQSTMPVKADAASDQGTSFPPLASFEPAWSLPLRRPLVEKPAPAGAANDAPAKPAGPSVRLIGTIVDGDHPRGVFMVGLSTIVLKSVGDVVGSAKVVSIENNAATLSFQGETLVLHREKKPFDPSGESYDAVARPSAPGSDAKGQAEGGVPANQ